VIQCESRNDIVLCLGEGGESLEEDISFQETTDRENVSHEGARRGSNVVAEKVPDQGSCLAAPAAHGRVVQADEVESSVGWSDSKASVVRTTRELRPGCHERHQMHPSVRTCRIRQGEPKVKSS